MLLPTYTVYCVVDSPSIKWARQVCILDYSFNSLSHRLCSYINKTAAFESGLVSIKEDGLVIMKADDTTKLDRGVFRNRFGHVHEGLQRNSLYS